MRKTKFNVAALLALMLAMLMCLFACAADPAKEQETPATTDAATDAATDVATDAATDAATEIPAEGLWKNATYRKDTTIGNGAKEVKIDVVVNKDTVVLTLKTDKATLGEALFSEGLVNDASFFDVLNGIKADWNADKAYWAFYKGEDYMMHGINDEKITGGEHYRFVYTK